MKQVQLWAGRDSEWSNRFRQACTVGRALCRGEEADNRKIEEVEGTELNGVEEGEDEMSDEEGDGIDGEEELAPPDWRVRTRPRNKTDAERKGRA